MNQAIYFRTSMFDVSKERENPLNPIYGVSLLDWLREETRGTLRLSEPDAEDWGWYSELEYEGNRYLIGACAQFEEGDDPAAELDWVFQVDKYRSFKDKLFGRNKMSDSDSCLAYFRELFEGNENFREVKVG